MTRHRPPRKRRESRHMRDLFHLRNRKPAAIARANQRTNARARNRADRNAFLFENLENADVSNAAGKASAQRHANRGNARRRNRRGLAGYLPPKRLHRSNDLPQPFHSEPHMFGPRTAGTKTLLSS